MNKYQYTRSIGFQLLGEAPQLKPNFSSQNKKELLQDFITQYENLLRDFKKAFLFEDSEGKMQMTNFVEIKYPWLKQHARERYFSKDFDRTKHKKYSINGSKSAGKAVFLVDILLDFLKRNKNLLKEINKLFLREENDSAKNSDLLLQIKQFFSAEYLFFVRDLLKYSNDKKNSEKLNTLKQTINNIQIFAENLLCLLSPNQSKGIEVARASLNFYTINKTPKEGFNKKLEEKNKELENQYSQSSNDLKFLTDVGFTKYIESKYIGSNPNSLSIENLYDTLKKFKAEQKSSFMEAVDQESWKIFEEDVQKQTNKNTAEWSEIFKQWIKKEFPLFDAKPKDLQKFLEQTEDIKELGVEKNQAQQRKDFNTIKIAVKKLRDTKIKRGKFFQQKFGFGEYVKYCDIFKRVAINLGNIKAEIRSIEQEQIEARLLQYWAGIIDDSERKKLLLIPRENISLVKQKIAKNNQLGDKKLILFNSLTLRALEKLLRKNYPKIIPEINESEEKLVNKLQAVLKGEYPKIVLDFSGFEKKIKEIAHKKYSSKEEFRIDLEAMAYVLQEHYITDEFLKMLQKDYKAFTLEISAYDLKRNLTSEKREHTKIWEKFWGERKSFSTRINPEIRIFYRLAKEQEEVKQQNRFSQEQVRVQFSITENAGNSDTQFAFASKKDLLDQINLFNGKVIKPFVEKREQKEKLWYYGIDRGNQELATLGVVQWTKQEYEAMLSNGKKKSFKKPKFANFTIYEIKDIKAVKEMNIDTKGNKKTVKIVDNPSNFIEDLDKNFTKKKVSFLDMTTAKVIKKKIITDGDIKTYINLKKANGKRKLFEAFSQIDKKAKVEYCDENHSAWNEKIGKEEKTIFRNSFLVKNKKAERNDYALLCYFSPEQETKFGATSKEELKNELSDYLKILRKDPTVNTVSIEQINNLRDAITANMVGVISCLFKKFPGIINLENLQSKKDIDRHFASSNENISRRLEWALYRKFQKSYYVPPRLKNTIFLRENMKTEQLGIIHFIPTKNTSANCPYCEEKADSKQRKSMKWSDHHYRCTNEKCGFSTAENKKEPLGEISNSDDVASYNIAKSPLNEA